VASERRQSLACWCAAAVTITSIQAGVQHIAIHECVSGCKVLCLGRFAGLRAGKARMKQCCGNNK
jgi:hypothetical protein